MRILKCFLSAVMLLFIIMLSSCGSGLIGLLRTDKHDRIVMDDVYVIEESGHIFSVEVIGYYEPDVTCEGLQPLSVVPDWIELNVWMDSKEMENGYIGPVQKFLHEIYYFEICGG